LVKLLIFQIIENYFVSGFFSSDFFASGFFSTAFGSDELAFVAVFAGVDVFAFPAIESGELEFVFVSTAVFAFASAAVFVFESTTGAVEVESSVVCKTEIFPVKAGIESKSADSIKQVAAIIVNFDKTLAAPRGVKAVLETLLVKSAPASVFPGCSRTAPIKTKQETKNNPYKK
jgi:hypothetical protein